LNLKPPVFIVTMGENWNMLTHKAI
jgi:hypothetical protein